jgi:hypothetical protein
MRIVNSHQIRNIFGRPHSAGAKSLTYGLAKFIYFLKWLLIGTDSRIRLTDNDLIDKRRRLAVSVGVIIILLMMVSGTLGYLRQNQLKFLKQIENISQRTQWVINQADELSGLSAGRAAELVRSERRSLEKRRSEIKNRKLIEGLDQQITALTDAETRASRKTTVIPELYLSLNMLKPNVSGRRLAEAENQIAVLSHDNIVMVISMKNRGGEVTAGGDLIKDGIDVAVDDNKIFVLTKKKVVEVPTKSKIAAETVNDDENLWIDPFKISTFGGSIFVFDRGASTIYKYPGIETGYGSPRQWLAEEAADNFSDIVDAAIDGDIWLLRQDGDVNRLRRGLPVKFEPSELPEAVINPQAISVPMEGRRVFILDNSTRVIALDRESGEYVGQWVFEAIGTSDFAVSETLGKIFLLAGENIYSFGFK